MSSTPPNPVHRKPQALWFALIVVVICTVGILWLLKPEPHAAMAQAATAPHTPSAGPASSIPPTSNTTMIVQQQAAATAAAMHDIHVQPIIDRVSARPDFISEIEWQTLKMVAQKSQNPDQELTRLVSNMRFNKQMDVWQSLPHTADHTQRDALATQLLADIPTAVNNQALDKAEAQKAQITLINDLEADPHARQQRIAQETARIGMRFDIQESRS